MILLISNICMLTIVALALLVIAALIVDTFLEGKSFALLVLYILLLGAVIPRVYMSLF